jgi:hypothetical protein
MRFGVPAFNSLTTFFSGFYNTGAGQLARTGRATGVFYEVGLASGFIVSLISWKVVAIHLLSVIVNFSLQKPRSKFYYLKPTMPLYWNAVNTIVNQIAVNRGIVPRVFGKDDVEIKDNYDFTESDRATLNQKIPAIFASNGSIDVYSLAGRAQRLARTREKKIQALVDQKKKLGITDMSVIMQQINSEAPADNKTRPYREYLNSWLKTAQSVPRTTGNSGATADTTVAQATNNAAPSTGTATPATDASGESAEGLVNSQADAAGLFDFITNEWDDGTAFVGFRVNATGPINESFSNSVTESELASKINGMSSSSRSTRFDFAGGNVDDGIVGKFVGGAVNAVADVVSGLASGIGVSGLASLAGSAFVDIPKHWQSSMASLPRASYTINLVSPYGNPVSQLLNLHIPLAMLLAGALPLSTGTQSYTSPFLVELYDKGRCQTRLGMIDSLSITRGTGNMGFNNEGNAMGIDVSFSIVDMSSVMSMPISEGFSLNPLKDIGNIFDDDNVFTDYMNVLAGLGLQDQVYTKRRLKLNLTQAMAQWESWTSPSHFANFVGDLFPSRLIAAFYKGTARP